MLFPPCFLAVLRTFFGPRRSWMKHIQHGSAGGIELFNSARRLLVALLCVLWCNNPHQRFTGKKRGWLIPLPMATWQYRFTGGRILPLMCVGSWILFVWENVNKTNVEPTCCSFEMECGTCQTNPCFGWRRALTLHEIFVHVHKWYGWQVFEPLEGRNKWKRRKRNEKGDIQASLCPY